MLARDIIKGVHEDREFNMEPLLATAEIEFTARNLDTASSCRAAPIKLLKEVTS